MRDLRADASGLLGLRPVQHGLVGSLRPVPLITFGGCAGTRVKGRSLTEWDQDKSISGISQRNAVNRRQKAEKEAAKMAKAGAKSGGRGGGGKSRARGNN